MAWINKVGMPVAIDGERIPVQSSDEPSNVVTLAGDPDIKRYREAGAAVWVVTSVLGQSAVYEDAVLVAVDLVK